MAVKCLIILALVSLLGVVCAREMKLASNLKVDPGIFVSLETLRRLEARAKNNGTDTNEIANTTSAEELDNVDEGGEVNISTTSTPDNENEVSNDPNEEPKDTASEDVENQTSQPIDSNDTADGSVDALVTSNANQQPNGNMQWPFPSFQYPYIPYPISLGALPNQQNLGYYQINPLLVNEQSLSNKNSSQTFLVNPQAPLVPNQYYQPTFIGQQPYPVLQQINPQMNLLQFNPNLMPLPYSQMYQPVVNN